MALLKGHISKFKIRYDWFLHTVEMADGKTKSTSLMSTRLDKLATYFDILTEAYEGILNACTNDAEHTEIIKKYEKLYEEATESYNKLEAISAGFPSTAGTFMPTDSAPTARLPRINLTSFDGDVFSWNSFISLFSSLVLTRTNISKTEKFHYLFSNVENEPKSLIRHLPMIDSSLDTALELLRSRYENIRLLADSHISRILHLPVLKQATGLRTKILNPLLESTRALKNLGLPTDQWSYLLFYISLNKLPIDIKTRFEQLHGGNHSTLPTFETLSEFLSNECRLIDTATEPAIYPESGHGHSSERPRRGERAIHLGKITHTENNNKCAYCAIPGHTIYDCFKFRKLDRTERKNVVRSKYLCFKCFGDHSAAECTRVIQCSLCGHSGHDNMICLSYPRPINGDQESGMQGARNAHVSPRDRWNGAGAGGDRGRNRVQGYRADTVGSAPPARRSDSTRFSAPLPRPGYQGHVDRGDVRNGWNRTRDDRDNARDIETNRRWSRGPSPTEARRPAI